MKLFFSVLTPITSPGTQGTGMETSYRDVTLRSLNTLLWTGQKQQADRWGLCLGAGDLCVALLFVYLCICGAHAFVYINVLVCASSCECAHVCIWFFGGEGGSQGAALCLLHLPPHSSDTQGNGRERGGEFILGRKKRIRVHRSNGQQCWFHWWAKGKGHRLGVWKPIYQSIWQNSGPPPSRSTPVCLIRHTHPWLCLKWESDSLYFAHLHTDTPTRG